MAASAADIRSALSIPEASSSAGPSQPKKQGATARKPEGISRELYSLIGPSQPLLAAQLAKPRLKQKPKFATGGYGATKWELRAFKNTARKDGLELQHWVKASEDPNTEYSFAKYNVQNPIYTYSQEEYTRFLEEKPWTKELTDYLFQLYQEYDGRWYIIWDRAEFPPEVIFDIDDLKDRYYSVCRKLVRNRPWAGDEASKSALMNSLNFDKNREVMRKKYLVSLESRTPEQLAEEEALYVEIRRLEQTERRFKREREELLRTVAGIESGLPDIVEDDGGPLGVTPEVRTSAKKRKGASGVETDSPATPSGLVASPSIKRPQNTKNAAHDAQHCIFRTDLSPNTPATKAAHQPAYLRSSKIPYLKNNSMQSKILQSFAEMGLSPTRLVMPTRENCAQLEALLEAVSAMVETKKHLDKVEYDIQVVKNQLGGHSADGDGGEGEDGQGEGYSGMKSEDAMDVDETQEAGETETEGRGQSVVSVRSARSRKKTHRSVSISSVDTTATSVSTRANAKRQKRS